LGILVGHKGIGKSALFKVAISEDVDRNAVPVLIKPDGADAKRFEVVNVHSGNGRILHVNGSGMKSIALRHVYSARRPSGP
jgi:hypothetical protein